jgi:hypothetical protein
MNTSFQPNPTPMEHAPADGHPNAVERIDDPCTRIHLYQQQLRAELLSAAADVSHSPAWWPRRTMSQARPRRALAAIREIEDRLKVLTDAAASYTYHRVISLGLAPAEA